MKRRLLTILVGIVLFLLPGCSNGDIADQIVKKKYRQSLSRCLWARSDGGL